MSERQFIGARLHEADEPGQVLKLEPTANPPWEVLCLTKADGFPMLLETDIRLQGNAAVDLFPLIVAVDTASAEGDAMAMTVVRLIDGTIHVQKVRWWDATDPTAWNVDAEWALRLKDERLDARDIRHDVRLRRYRRRYARIGRARGR